MLLIQYDISYESNDLSFKSHPNLFKQDMKYNYTLWLQSQYFKS